MYIATLDKAAALPIATSSPVTSLHQFINSDLGYSDLKIQPLCSKIATVISFEVAISNALSFYRLNFTFFYQMSFGNSDRAAYSDLNPRDGGQSLYPMSTVIDVPEFFFLLPYPFQLCLDLCLHLSQSFLPLAFSFDLSTFYLFLIIVFYTVSIQGWS